MIINLCSDQKNADADIKPQHHDRSGGKTAVKGRVSAEFLYIVGEQLREDQPAQRSADRARERAARRNAPIGKYAENGNKEDA